MYIKYSSQYKKNNFTLSVGQDKGTSIHQTYFVFVPLFSKFILTRQKKYIRKTLKSF